jgi:hypothetical protein
MSAARPQGGQNRNFSPFVSRHRKPTCPHPVRFARCTSCARSSASVMTGSWLPALRPIRAGQRGWRRGRAHQRARPGRQRGKCCRWDGNALIAVGQLLLGKHCYPGGNTLAAPDIVEFRHGERLGEAHGTVAVRIDVAGVESAEVAPTSRAIALPVQDTAHGASARRDACDRSPTRSGSSVRPALGFERRVGISVQQAAQRTQFLRASVVGIPDRVWGEVPIARSAQTGTSIQCTGIDAFLSRESGVTQSSTHLAFC